MEQVHELVGRPIELPWDRCHILAADNDRGRTQAMRTIGARLQAFHRADRAAQEIMSDVEVENRRALAAALRIGPLLIVTTAAPTASAIHDVLLAVYGEEDTSDVLVATASTWGLSRDGRVISDLPAAPCCWYGGELPGRGFCGAPLAFVGQNSLPTRILGHLPPPSHPFSRP